MAVKTSWSAGDVLTAADLTDTFAAKAPLASPTFTGNVVWSASTLRASSATVATGQTTTSTSYTDLATSGPAVTVTTGTKAFVIITTWLRNNTSTQIPIASFAVSGATTRAASDDESVQIYMTGSNVPYARMSAGFIVTGLTAGSNTFTMKYRGTGNTSEFEDRQISVIDMGS